ncbi:MAG: DUF1788 domain-containing protein [Arcobacteraceae bacterium]
MKDRQYAPINERYKHLYDVMSSQKFKNKEGLGNEVPFFICPFKPKEYEQIDKMKVQLFNKLNEMGTSILEINLYDLAIEILKENGDFTFILENETKIDKVLLEEDLKSILDIQDNVMPLIAKTMKENTFDILFLTGIGEVYPLIRSHNILNNLQKVAREKPTVMFYPGDYKHSLEKGASLELFELLRDDKYYRAFNIYHYEI